MALIDSFGMALHRLWRRPSLAIVTIGTLGAAIGLTASVFAILDAVLWRPLPIHDPQRLLWVETVASGEPDGSSPGLLVAWSERARSLTSVAGIRAANATIDDAEGIDRIQGAYVSAAYFDALGVAAVRGQVFGPERDRPGADPIVIISHRLWQQRYRGDESTVGRVISFNGRPRTIVGILPREMDVIDGEVNWWAPLALPASQRSNVGPSYLDVVGRLAPGATLETAHGELTALTEGAGAKADDGSLRGVRLTLFDDHLNGPHAGTLWLLFGAVLIVFIIACANVANLHLADGLNRRTEIAVRASLGASRVQILTQMAIEAIVVSAGATVAGVIVAQWLIDVLIGLIPGDLPRLRLAAVDPRTIIAAGTAGLCAACVAGLIPTLSGSRVDVVSSLRGGGRSLTSSGAKLRRAFVIAQIALTMALTTVGALLIRSAYALQHAPRGYESNRVLTAAFTLPASMFPDGASQSAAFDRVLDAASTVPGVRSTAIATRVPLAGSGAGSDLARLDQSFDDGVNRQVRIRLVSPGYFTTLQIPLLAGRDFTRRDRREAQPVLIVNEALSKRLGRQALVGSPLKFALREFNAGSSITPWEVVGIVGDTLDQGPRTAAIPEVFIPLGQAPSDVLGWMGGQALLAVQAEGDATTLAPSLRAALARGGIRLPLYDVRTLDERLAAHVATERVLARLLGFLASAGLLLSGLGMFAVLSQIVRRQRREFALMLALGATRATMIVKVLRDGAGMALVGLAFGLVGTLAMTESVRPLLFGVTTTDSTTLAAVGGLLVVLTLLASWLPARSVARLDPATVLREE